MSSPSPLVAFYDRLARHDWAYDYSDDSSVYRRGATERQALVAEARQSPEAQALFDAYLAYSHTRLSQPQAKPPARPEPTAVVTPAPAPVPAGVLADLDEADQARVRQAKDPQAALAQIQARQTVDDRESLVDWLPRLGATQDPANPARWNLPDGAQVRVKEQSWIHLVNLGQRNAMAMMVPQANGQGVVRLVARLQGVDEGQALAVVQGATPAPIPAAQVSTPVPPAPPIPVVATSTPPSVATVTRPTRRYSRS